MQYMLLIYGDEKAGMTMSPEEQEASMGEWFGYTEELRASGAMAAGDALQPTGTATTVSQANGGDALITDGPFAETREQLGGYYLLNVADLDEAIVWAKKCPGARYGQDRAAARSWSSIRAERPAAPSPAADAVARTFRAEFGRAVAILARALGGDVDRAEEAVQDAYAVALDRWPRDGVPSQPAGWILTTAKRRAIDRLRREAVLREKQALIARELEEAVADVPERRGRPDDPRRAARADVRVLPSRARDRGAGAADPAPRRRPHRARRSPARCSCRRRRSRSGSCAPRRRSASRASRSRSRRATGSTAACARSSPSST